MAVWIRLNQDISVNPLSNSNYLRIVEDGNKTFVELRIEVRHEKIFPTYDRPQALQAVDQTTFRESRGSTTDVLVKNKVAFVSVSAADKSRETRMVVEVTYDGKIPHTIG
jgi:hypothetical protein